MRIPPNLELGTFNHVAVVRVFLFRWLALSIFLGVNRFFCNVDDGYARAKGHRLAREMSFSNRALRFAFLRFAVGVVLINYDRPLLEVAICIIPRLAFILVNEFRSA